MRKRRIRLRGTTGAARGVRLVVVWTTSSGTLRRRGRVRAPPHRLGERGGARLSAVSFLHALVLGEMDLPVLTRCPYLRNMGTAPREVLIFHVYLWESSEIV